MLNKPQLSQMMRYVDSKYTLVIVASKYARSTIDNNPDMLNNGTINPVTLALDEVAEGRIDWHRTKDGAK